MQETEKNNIEGNNNRKSWKKQLVFVESWYIDLKDKHKVCKVVRMNVMRRNGNKEPIEMCRDKKWS